MITESIDILWIALAIATLALAFFSCWAMYYVVQLLKSTRDSINDLHKQVEHVHQVLNTAESVLASFRERFASTGAALGTIASAIKFFFEQRSKKSERYEE